VAKIAIDYTPAYEQGGGIGRYVRELVTALAKLDSVSQYRLFVAGAKTLPAAPGANFTWSPTKISPRWWARVWHRAQIPLPIELFTGRVNLFHATDFTLPPTLCRTILTVHDLSFVRVPETTSPTLKHYLDKVVPRSIKRADHILADSQATKDDLIALYNTPSDKVTVLLSGVEPRFRPIDDLNSLERVRVRYALPDRPYILSVGTVQPRKNYVRLVEALGALRGQGIDVSLVIVGAPGWLAEPIYETIKKLRLSEFVRFTGFADDADLPALYTGAVCVALPSLYEGFGLPVLEAMACGTPVLTSNVSSLPEVAGDAALLVDPHETQAIADGLMRLITDSALRNQLTARGYQQAARFTWDRSARELQAVYHRLLT
jgi:glycosyltransferase involved in cell wall biosynthesis